MSTKTVTEMIFDFKGVYNANGIYKSSHLFCFQGHEIPLSPCPFSPHTPQPHQMFEHFSCKYLWQLTVKDTN